MELEPRPTEDMLFSDGLLEIDINSGYRGTVAANAVGISYRQLDYWARTDLVVPSVRGAQGSGSQRLYAFKDIIVLKLVKNLQDTGISMQQIRSVVNELRASGITDLASITLMSDGATVYLCTSQNEIIDILNGGQGVFGIAVGTLMREVESTLINIDTDPVEPMDELAARRASRGNRVTG